MQIWIYGPRDDDLKPSLRSGRVSQPRPESIESVKWGQYNGLCTWRPKRWKWAHQSTSVVCIKIVRASRLISFCFNGRYRRVSEKELRSVVTGPNLCRNLDLHRDRIPIWRHVKWRSWFKLPVRQLAPFGSESDWTQWNPFEEKSMEIHPTRSGGLPPIRFDQCGQHWSMRPVPLWAGGIVWSWRPLPNSVQNALISLLLKKKVCYSQIDVYFFGIIVITCRWWQVLNWETNEKRRRPFSLLATRRISGCSWRIEQKENKTMAINGHIQIKWKTRKI